MLKNQKGLSTVVAILIVLIVAVVLGGIYYFYFQKEQSSFDSSEDMVKPEANIEEGMEAEENMDSEDSYRDVSVREAKELIDSNQDLIIIDVSPHYDSGHLPGALSYYLGDGSLDRAIPSLDKGATYLVYCHVDSVAIAGAERLVDAGFKNVYRLEGNYSAWVSAGYEIEK